MGTRSWNTKFLLPPDLQDPQYKKKRQMDMSEDEEGRRMVPVQVYQQRIRYRCYFAIPELLALALVGLILLGAAILFALGRGTPTRIDHFLIHLSSGRLLGSMQHPTEDKDAPTVEWIRQVGRKQSDLGWLSAAYAGKLTPAGGLSPYFAQSTAYREKGQPANGDYDTQPRPTSSTGKG